MPIVALLGRPNVGKSTLFNRITKSKDALVDNFPGVTRDRHYGKAVWEDVPFTLVDTGGFSEDESDGFSAQIRSQVRQAIDDADVIVLVLDGKEGLSPYDTDLIDLLRSVSQPVLYVVNKIDGLEQEDRLFDFYQLGMETIYPVSAEHGYGVPDFLDEVVTHLTSPESVESDDLINIAVVGRPNAGKSSLINRLLGEDRLLVSDVPGTTRDAIDTICKMGEKSYRLIDTAGIRRKGKVSRKIEKFSVIKALKSLERCDVALIVLDADEGITDQDVRIAGYAHDRGCGCLFLLNKWDLVEKDTRTAKRFFEELRRSAKFLGFAPVLTISAKTGQRVSKIFKTVEEIYAQYASRISTGKLNRIVEKALSQNEPSLHKGKRIKFYYASQVGTKPPTFVFFVNYPEAVHFSYQRYLNNQIREMTHLDCTPLKIRLKLRTGRIEFGKKKQKGKRTKSGKR